MNIIFIIITVYLGVYMLTVFERLDFKTNEVGLDIIFRKGKYAGTLFFGHMEVCTDPCCPCYKAKFIFIFHPDPAGVMQMNTGIQPYEFYVDLEEKQYILNNNEKDFLPENRNIAKAFINELTEENWKELIDEFECYKAYISDFVNPDDIKIDIDFSKVRIKHDGERYYYNQLFPFCLEYFFSNDRYTIDDKYCMDPECSCTEAEVTIIPCEPDGPDIEFLTDAEMIIKYDYQNKNWKAIQKSSDKIHDLNKIVPLMIESIPGFIEILKKRHKIMKGVYLKNQSKDNSRQVKNKLKVGRNSPCPCGSGKKYKKCCGK